MTGVKKRRLPATEAATFTPSRFRIIIPHPGEPEPEPEINDIPRCVSKYEGPLSKCNKIGTRMRKLASIANDFEKERLNVKVRTLAKEQNIITNKYNSEVQPIQRSLQELQGYRTVLGQKRMTGNHSINQSLDSLPTLKPSVRPNSQMNVKKSQELTPRPKTMCLPPYGMYEGVAIRELRDDIKKMVEENHPRARRIRQAHRLMETNKDEAINKQPHLLMEKMEDIMTRPWAEFKLIPKDTPDGGQFKHDSNITATGISGPAVVEQSGKGYGNFYTSASQALVFN